MRRLLLIVGPTATGKTRLALHLSKKCNGEILSADSRQVYKGMDIGTGKDVPGNFIAQISELRFNRQNIPFYANGTKIWGYDLVSPAEEFSVAHFLRMANLVIKDMWKRKKLPIVVGGTGLYLKGLTQPLEKVHIPPNTKLRADMKDRSVRVLTERLKRTNPDHLEKMNDSDRHNPRRLIRAIETSNYLKSHPKALRNQPQNAIAAENVRWIGLRTAKGVLYRRIDERVTKRIQRGAENEVRKLLEKGYGFDMPAMSALGYIQWEPYFNGKVKKPEVIKRWRLNEHAYARRQLTWFKKNKSINWFNATDSELYRKVVRDLRQWYSEC
jgi:tRNA dimethylallyltransferase